MFPPLKEQDLPGRGYASSLFGQTYAIVLKYYEINTHQGSVMRCSRILLMDCCDIGSEAVYVRSEAAANVPFMQVCDFRGVKGLTVRKWWLCGGSCPGEGVLRTLFYIPC